MLEILFVLGFFFMLMLTGISLLGMISCADRRIRGNDVGWLSGDCYKNVALADFGRGCRVDLPGIY